MCRDQDHSCALRSEERLRDSSEEIRSAAAWARRLLERNPKAQIGVIVVPDLTRSRPSGRSRFLRQVLGRGGVSSFSGPLLGGVSVGPRRAADAGIRTGLIAVAARGNAVAIAISRGRGKGMGQARATGRQSCGRTASGNYLCRACARRQGAVPNCSACCAGVRKAASDASRKSNCRASGAAASRICSKLLAGRATALQRACEFQTIEAWRELLSGLASLDLTAPPMNLRAGRSTGCVSRRRILVFKWRTKARRCK